MVDIGMSAGELAQMGDLVRAMTHNVELLTQKVVFGVEYTLRSQKDIIAGDQSMHDKMQRNSETARARMKRQEEERRKELRETHGIIFAFADAHARKIDDINHRWQRVGDTIKKSLSHGTGATGMAGNAMGISGNRGIAQGVMGQIAQMSNMLPMGGLLGLALFGAMKHTEWAAAAHKSSREFAQVGTVAKSTTKEISRLATSLGPSFGMDPSALAQELSAVASGFAAVGIAGDEAAKKIPGVGKSAIEATFALDTLFKAATGTFATAVGQAVESTGSSVADATKEIQDLGLSLRNTGINVVQTVGQMMQLTMGMRLQRQSVADVASQYNLLRGALASGAMAGASSSAIGRASMAGIQGVAAGISGMSEGMMAVMAERISGRTGNQVSGIDALIKFQEGALGGKGGDMMGQVTRELGAFAKEITGGGSREEQIFALMKSNPALGFEGSRAIVDMQKAIDEGVEPAKAGADAQKALKNAFKDRAAETSAFQTKMMEMTMAMAKTGAGVLALLMSTLGELPSLLKAFFIILDPTAGATEKSGARAFVRDVETGQTNAVKQIGAGVKDLFNVYLKLGETTAALGMSGAAGERRTKLRDALGKGEGPVTTEQAVENAIDTALDLHNWSRGLPVQIIGGSMHIGLEAGKAIFKRLVGEEKPDNKTPPKSPLDGKKVGFNTTINQDGDEYAVSITRRNKKGIGSLPDDVVVG